MNTEEVSQRSNPPNPERVSGGGGLVPLESAAGFRRKDGGCRRACLSPQGEFARRPSGRGRRGQSGRRPDRSTGPAPHRPTHAAEKRRPSPTSRHTQQKKEDLAPPPATRSRRKKTSSPKHTRQKKTRRDGPPAVRTHPGGDPPPPRSLNHKASFRPSVSLCRQASAAARSGSPASRASIKGWCWSTRHSRSSSSNALLLAM